MSYLQNTKQLFVFSLQMEAFGFTQAERNAANTVFNGSVFYTVYKDADFLRIDANIENLLTRGYEVRQKMKTIPVGDSLVIQGMKLERNTPLIIKRGGRGVTVEDFEFTYNRLQGLVAAFAYENRHRFPVLEASEPKSLGLVWDNENEEKCKLYLSAISGTDSMIDQFSFFPFICGLRKFQLKKIPLELVVGMGYVKNNEGLTMARLLNKNLVMAKRIWLMFPGSSLREMETLVNTTPHIKKLFQV
ncbi:unnamed protein product [Arctia plantaginis]|uniref:Uncharacterized protein n=1 Tax=Arctia plantaginis TaxID=874455 RepID=A0A8S1BNX8_ARCPL|nr:unnamed protein product [Arctia plantaginis]CAB3260574.1 unnamed protein product [Arctia plantaginis]